MAWIRDGIRAARPARPVATQPACGVRDIGFRRPPVLVGQSQSLAVLSGRRIVDRALGRSALRVAAPSSRPLRYARSPLGTRPQATQRPTYSVRPRPRSRSAAASSRAPQPLRLSPRADLARNAPTATTAAHAQFTDPQRAALAALVGARPLSTGLDSRRYPARWVTFTASALARLLLAGWMSDSVADPVNGTGRARTRLPLQITAAVARGARGAALTRRQLSVELPDLWAERSLQATHTPDLRRNCPSVTASPTSPTTSARTSPPARWCRLPPSTRVPPPPGGGCDHSAWAAAVGVGRPDHRRHASCTCAPSRSTTRCSA